MSKITQRDLLESIVGLRAIAHDLRVATEHAEGSTVEVSVRGMMEHATYLDQVANELAGLIPDRPVKIPSA